MLADGGRFKGRHHPGLPALAPRADRAIECSGVHDVVVVGGELVPVLHHHVLQHLLDRVVVGKAQLILCRLPGMSTQGELASEMDRLSLCWVARCWSVNSEM